MYSTRKQRTIATTVSVSGIGYWSGRDIRVEFCPAPSNTGIVFVRTDLDGQPRIPARVENLLEIPRRTALGVGNATVEMVEHIMAALAGMQIDNCEIRVNEAEMPGCDGSCLPFVMALQSAGIVEQEAERQCCVIRRVIRKGSPDCWIEARPCCADKMIIHYELDYGVGNAIGRQSLEVSLSPRHFHLNLAPSRTFMLEAEAEALKAQGLGQRTTCKDLLVFNCRGPIDNTLRFPDECVRHKVTDLIGDLALSGCDLVGRFVAYRSGHRLNAELVREIIRQSQSQQIQNSEKIRHQLKRCA